MKKLFTLLLSVFAIGGVSAQSTDTGYRAVPVAEKAWPQTATVATTDNSKDVVFRSNNHPDYFVSSTDTELKVMNDGTRDVFRIFSTATANQYKIYNVTKSKFVKWKQNANVRSVTELVLNADDANNTWLIVNNNNGNNAKIVDIIAGGRTAYENRAPCWNPHGGFGHNKVIGTWDANDANSSWQICEAMALTAPEFVTNYNATEKWYSVTLRGKKVAYDREANKMNFSDLPGAPSLFQFVGTRDGFKIYNRAAGNTKALGSANVATNEDVLPVEAAMAKTFRLEMGYDRGRCQDAWVIRSTTTNNGYLHDYREKVSYWVNGNAKTDYGSVFVFTPEIFNPLAEFNYEKSTALALLNEWKGNASIKAIYGEDNISSAISTINGLNPAENETEGNRAVQTIVAEMERLYANANGKKIVLTCPLYPTRRMAVDLYGKLMGVETTETTASHVFVLKANKASLQLTHAASGRKVQTQTEFNKAILADNTAANYALKTVAGNNEQVAFECQDVSGKETACLHMASSIGYAIVRWNAQSIGASTWKVEVVNSTETDIKNAAKARLSEAEALYASSVGSSLQQFSQISNQAYDNAKSPNADVAMIETGVKAILNGEVYKLNLPRQGQFLRIKSKGGVKYVSMNPVTAEGVNKDRLSTVTSADASTLFYYNGTTLTGVQSGKGIGVIAKPGNDGYKAYVLPHGQEPKNVHFRVAPANKKYYNILVGEAETYDSQGLWIRDNSAFVDGSTNWRDGDDANRLQLEEVTEIQVPLGSAGVASFVIPATVKMTVSSGTKAYKVTQTGSGTATLTSLDGVIGNENSEVAIVLKGTPDTNATLTVSATNVQGAADISGNMLIGSVAASATTNKTAEGDYGLKVSGSEAYFAKTNADIPFRPFRAVLRTTTAQGVSAFSLNFGEDNVTAIETVDTTTQDAPIFDLSGRRVTKTVKGGVYIKNGQKIVQQ
ncbi:hypothetical protein EII14_02925 [Alloprevotella sp. OH1205_COT-284]|uniref:hypothetical protein n=1 Tax=Alloprevotella sp. OH1205_COT-284 TaxID=2491043 RepID=UPI000F5EEC44|nr:hypothetical protein [Alloprevotella sp. OH1205_COT-284]RRD80277.1 hypothetical protein EII14_02925 [Alloprevotella sp. OH1205_COT-284]